MPTPPSHRQDVHSGFLTQLLDVRKLPFLFGIVAPKMWTHLDLICCLAKKLHNTVGLLWIKDSKPPNVVSTKVVAQEARI
jgi:hypothetical protein